METAENLTVQNSSKIDSGSKETHKENKDEDSSSSSDSSPQEDNNKNKRKTMKSLPKRKIHSTKHKHRRVRSRSTSSDSSSSVDTSTSSSDTSASSNSSRERRLKKKAKLRNKKEARQCIEDEPSADIPINLMSSCRSMAPMTKEEWEKKQSIIKRVYDESTGRHRLIKGEGEVIEEIVSRDMHKQINQEATKGDGDYFEKQMKRL